MRLWVSIAGHSLAAVLAVVVGAALVGEWWALGRADTPREGLAALGQACIATWSVWWWAILASLTADGIAWWCDIARWRAHGRPPPGS